MPYREPRLQLVGGALCHQPPVVDEGHPIGQAIGLLQVLGREKDRHAAGHQVSHDVPEHSAATRVESGGRLVQEHDAGPSHERHGQVEPAYHPPRIGGHRSTRRVGQLEALQQFGRSLSACGAPEMVQVRHERQVLPTGEQLVDGRELPGDPDGRPDRLGVSGHVMAGDGGPPSVGRQQGGEDPHRRGLARPVRADQAQHGPLGDRQVQPVNRYLVPEGLPQANDLDGQARRRPRLHRIRGLVSRRCSSLVHEAMLQP